MTKDSNVKRMLPGPVERNLIQLGEHIRIARKRRKESLALWSERMQVSIPTIQKMEAGDPTVSVATYATALWLIGRVHFLGQIADPTHDDEALFRELKNIPKSRREQR